MSNNKTNIDLLRDCRTHLEYGIDTITCIEEDFTELMNRFEISMEFCSFINEFLSCDDKDLSKLRKKFKEKLIIKEEI